MPEEKNEADLKSLWISFYLVLVIASLFFRPLLPIDETRYVSVALEMRQSGDFLVPHINGAPYSHKPPLFFWLINLGWLLFGVNEWSARLTAPFFGFINLFLTAYLARLLWPEERSVSQLVPFVLLAFPLWAIFTTLTMFDMILTSFILLAAVGFLVAGQGKPVVGWGLAAAAIGGGLLTKGPVILICVLPAGLMAPWWMKGRGEISWRSWYAGLFFSMMAGVSIAMAWALPAANAGGAEYGRDILWGQTAGRMVKSFAHSRPVWWYLPLLPIVLFPWFFHFRLWGGQNEIPKDNGGRFCLSWTIPPLLFLSLISGKQIHYLIPLMPPVAIFSAKKIISMKRPFSDRAYGPVAVLFIITGTILNLLPYLDIYSSDIVTIENMSRVWGWVLFASGIIFFLWRPEKPITAVMGTCSAVVVLIIFLQLGPLRGQTPAYDVSAMAGNIARIQKDGKKVAHFKKYHDQYHFAGRLKSPIAVLKSREALIEWIKRNPDGYVVINFSKPFPAFSGKGPEYVHQFRGKLAVLWSARALAGAPEVMGRL